MIIPCKEITTELEHHLTDTVTLLKQRGIVPRLVTFLLDDSPDQLSFVTIKRKLALRIGAEFILKHYPQPPSFTDILEEVKQTAADPLTTGIIIQLPLPEGYDKQQLFNALPPLKDIEGHTAESQFHFPLALAVASGLKFLSTQDTANAVIELPDDRALLQESVNNKTIVIAGRGETGGRPIAELFDELGIVYQITHSQTTDAQSIYRSADIIITATGRTILHAEDLKPGVTLLNVGLHKNDGKLKGDYEETEVEQKAAWYTKTPGGLGPLDVLYLYKNLIEAAIKQHE
ncbi:MAG: tetrahydrofolate dehydrogenase/cyclohydrolase catalytic domain-containing protein [Weeksellaceae bacterium]